MAIEAFIDTNVLLDYLDPKRPLHREARTIMTKCSEGRVDGFISSISIADCMYILHQYSLNEKKEMIENLNVFLDIQGVDKLMIMDAVRDVSFTDFEDCLQYQCALAIGVDYIITNNVRDFRSSEIAVFTPQDFCHEFLQ